ncbi:MAG: NAD(P)/FAD-dependent oxidoreductase [Drouetiella hepatica Uher 2000/2452]|jgi:monoamine oxidase|uniref:NAD(P)/FAD-dependent oxidoreductase n=1 Tax=Drouetiella hepatica Uher 2000/2452 TaxID=904376 RepID=A0A951Q7L0_9CYAN|nr:NAD(P)/FAD-dependent oxidoreductase [Drouetiella hepatica Uher 2000/2452]
MSKSALANLLRRAYQAAQISHKAQIPIAEVTNLSDRTLITRRQVLGGIAATGLLPRLGQRPIFPVNSVHSARDAKILIVGAGIAGLTVAYRLRQAGVPVELIEASHRTGGRLRSLRGELGDVVELGGEFIDSRHTAVRSLAAELGLELADLRSADLGLEPEILYFQGRKITQAQVAEAFSPLAQRIAQDLRRLGDRAITYRNPNPNAVRLDRLSLAEYLAIEPIDPVIDQLVRVAYMTEFGRDAESQSCLNMLFLIGAEVGKWSTYGVSDERYHVVGGNEQIPQRLAALLEGTIATGTLLESIRLVDNRYEVSLRQGSTSFDRTYDQVILTVPFTTLRQVNLAVDLPSVKQKAIAELGYGTSSKLAVPYRERIWRSRYGSTISVYTDLDFQNTWESARYSTLPGGWVTDLRGGQAGIALANGYPEDQARKLTDDLERIFPGIAQVERGQAMRSIWANEPYALGSYACYLPGQWTQMGGVESERVGNLWFAGEHCSLGSQGYMNGACETAEQVAQGILSQLGNIAA